MAVSGAVGRVFALLVLTLLSGCGDPAGHPCAIVGDGFHASDPCRHRCLSRWSVVCPDGEAVIPGVCSGAFGCRPGSCPAGQACYHDNDPFDDRSYCLPADVCGVQADDTLGRWERQTQARQEETGAVRRVRESRRAEAATSGITAPVDVRTASAADMPAHGPAAALSCEADAQRDAIAIGPDALKRGARFSHDLPHGWRFVLEPAPAGWRVVLQDRPERSGAVDLASGTPPLRGPNPRDIAGWHFRDRHNLRPNQGEVNAPQYLRLFSFEPELIGSAGARSAAEGSGRGWLRIDALTLSPPVAGKQAHIEQMRFTACLTWPRVDDETRRRWRAALASSREALQRNHPRQAEAARLERCGLDLDRFELTGRLPSLALDIDGDGVSDLAALVERDGRAAIALCRGGGAALTLVEEGSDVLRTAYQSRPLAALERWYAVPGDRGPFGYVDEPGWPRMDGDALMLERMEKSLHALYWRRGAAHLHRVYRAVEP